MARPRGGPGSRGPRKPKTQAAADAPHSANYSEDSEHKLVATAADQWLRLKEAEDAAKKKRVEHEKALAKEGVTKADIKLYLELREPAGEEKLRAEFERKLQIARWAGMAVGEQAALFPDIDRTPLVERAHAAGKRAGIEGKGSGENPHDVNTEAGRSWEAGRVEGMAVQIQSGIKATEEGDGSTLIKANRPDAPVVQSNDEPEEEPDDGAPQDDESGLSDDASVDDDLPYHDRWKAQNAAAADA